LCGGAGDSHDGDFGEKLANFKRENELDKRLLLAETFVALNQINHDMTHDYVTEMSKQTADCSSSMVRTVKNDCM